MWKNPTTYVVIAVIALLALAIVVYASFLKTPCANAGEDCQDLSCYIKIALCAMRNIRYEIDALSRLNLCLQVVIVVLGVITTVMIGLQNDETKVWTRPIGLISATLGAALATSLTSFHIQDNIDKLIDIYGDIAKITNKLEDEVTANPANQQKLFSFFARDFDALMAQRLSLKGSEGKLSGAIVYDPKAKKSVSEQPK